MTDLNGWFDRTARAVCASTPAATGSYASRGLVRSIVVWQRSVRCLQKLTSSSSIMCMM